MAVLPADGHSFTILSQYVDFTSYMILVLNTALPYQYVIADFKDGGLNKGKYSANIGSLDINRWYHVAFVRVGTTGYFFIDGVRQTTTQIVAFGTNDTGNIAADVNIGGAVSGWGSEDFNGWMDELRISKGMARWSSDFTVPTEAYSGDTTVTIDQFNDGVDVFWKSYKTADAIGGIYECYNGIDKYTLTATDTYDDSTVS